MALQLYTAASSLAIDLATVKLHLGINWTDQDSLITDHIYAATEWVERQAGVCLVNQVWKEYFYSFPAIIELQKRPVVSVSSIVYLDGDGNPQTLASNTYRVSTSPRYLPTTISPVTIFPPAYSAYPNPELITITYTAGYGASIPAIATRAVLRAVFLIYNDLPLCEPGLDRLIMFMNTQGYN